jgi:hypothetical protein
MLEPSQLIVRELAIEIALDEKIVIHMKCRLGFSPSLPEWRLKPQPLCYPRIA